MKNKVALNLLPELQLQPLPSVCPDDELRPASDVSVALDLVLNNNRWHPLLRLERNGVVIGRVVFEGVAFKCRSVKPVKLLESLKQDAVFEFLPEDPVIPDVYAILAYRGRRFEQIVDMGIVESVMPALHVNERPRRPSQLEGKFP